MPNSAWTESGSSINLASATTPVSVSSSPEDVNYLTNADKITLMAQYAAELATKTVLDETAASLGLPVSGYDTSVAAIGTTLTGAGAPSNWATLWPDGTTFGPSIGVRTLLANAWSTVASNRGALQMAISAANAAKAKADAINASISSALALAASESIIPNGAFGTGDGTGWVGADNAVGTAGTFGTLPDGSAGITLSGGQSSICTPSFQVIPGKKYKIIFWLYAGSGSQSDWLRVFAKASRVANVTDQTLDSLVDFIAGGSLVTTSPAYYSYDWTPVAGQNFASLAIFEWSGATAPLYIKGVYCVPYVEAAYIDAGAVTAEAIASGAITAGKISAGAITGDMITAGVLTADVIYFSDGFALNTLEPKEGGADKTSQHVLTSKAAGLPADASHTYQGGVWLSDGTTGIKAVPGMGWTTQASGAADTFVISGQLPSAVGTYADFDVLVCVDGNTSVNYCSWNGKPNQPLYAVITGLSAGTHTIQIYANPIWNGSTWSIETHNAYAICQRIY